MPASANPAVHRVHPTGTSGAGLSDNSSRRSSFGNTENMAGWKAQGVVGPLVGLAVFLSACGSSATSSPKQTSSPRSACSLLTAQEASNALGEPGQAPHECKTYPGNQSGGIYSSDLPNSGFAARPSLMGQTSSHHVHGVPQWSCQVRRWSGTAAVRGGDRGRSTRVLATQLAGYRRPRRPKRQQPEAWLRRDAYFDGFESIAS